MLRELIDRVWKEKKSELIEDGVDTTFLIWDITAFLAIFLAYGALSTIEISPELPMGSIRIATVCVIYVVIYGIFKYLRD